MISDLAAPEHSCAWDTQLSSLCSRLEATSAGLRAAVHPAGAAAAAPRPAPAALPGGAALQQASQKFLAQLQRWGSELEPATSTALNGLVSFLHGHVVCTTAGEFARGLPLARAELASLAAQALSLRNAYESFCWDVERLSLTTVNALAAAELDLPAELAAAAAELGLGKGADGVDMACCAAVACKLLGPGGILFAPALAPEAVATQRKGQGQHNSRVAFARTVSAPLGSMAFSMGMQAVGSTLAELFDALRERLGRPEWVGPASPELQAAAVAGLHASLRRQAGGIKAACCSYSAAAGELRAALACGGQPAVLGKAGGAPVQGGASPAAPHSPPNRQDSLTCRQAPAEAH